MGGMTTIERSAALGNKRTLEHSGSPSAEQQQKRLKEVENKVNGDLWKKRAPATPQVQVEVQAQAAAPVAVKEANVDDEVALPDLDDEEEMLEKAPAAEEPQAEEPVAEEALVDLSQCKLAELKTMAKVLGLTWVSGLSKGKLIERLMHDI